MVLFIHGAGANVGNFINLWKSYGLSLWELVVFIMYTISGFLVPLALYYNFKGFGHSLSNFVLVYRTHPFIISGMYFTRTECYCLK